ncbi:hypothetical protein B0H17DRAFT_958446 [Mycena rosella]|uniref:Uncharacterized protein n=1 Tax=Mycena rosella TaxID=1033263 RepID=A0AAD7CHZ6_MYCRO|nr:hypothetical protein B0H17DRAFT_958446 [Mycena rosella]
MHLILNLFELLMGLWRGTLDCDPLDDRSLWDWTGLKDDVIWQKHGARVAAATPYLPNSFDRPPRNPAEAMSSGYKAQECLTYLFGLGPGLLRDILPDVYWRHYCKIVRGYRLIYQRKITKEEVVTAHKLLCEAVEDYESLYYRRLPSRLHFVRQSIHILLHEALEIIRLGPGTYYTQWTMERTIGNLGEEIKQHSDPYENLSQRVTRRAQVNALKSLIPDLEPDNDCLPCSSEDLGDSYALLRARDKYNQTICGLAGDAIKDYLEDTTGITYAENFSPSLQRWARLLLPNGQIARSAWKEKQKALNKVRMSRNIRFEDPVDGESYGEVQFYFQAKTDDDEIISLALISPYSPPDQDLLESSFNSLWVSSSTGDGELQIIEANTISSVVGMIPFDDHGRFFVVPKMGLEAGSMCGVRERDTES